MHAHGFLLVCLACVGYGRRVQNPLSKLSAFNLQNPMFAEIEKTVRLPDHALRPHVLARGNHSQLTRQQLANCTLEQLDSIGMLFLSQSPPAGFTASGPEVRSPVHNTAARSGKLLLHMNRKGKKISKVSVTRNKRKIISQAIAAEAVPKKGHRKETYPTQTLEEMGLLYSEKDLEEAYKAAMYADRAAQLASKAGERRAGRGRKRAYLEALEARREALSLALAAEFREEVQEAEERLNKWPVSRLRHEGYTCLGLTASEPKHVYACTPLSCSTDVILRFANASGSPLPFHKFSGGDLVKVTLDKGEESGHAKGPRDLEGMVVQRTKFYLSVAIPDDQVAFIEKQEAGSRWRLDMTANTVTHERRSEAVTALASPFGFVLPEESVEYYSPLQRALAGLTQGKQSPEDLAAYSPVWAGAKLAKSAPAIPRLNKSQRNAVRNALSRTLTLWQGPPGTGKTMTTCALVEAVVNFTSSVGLSGPKVLATSASNVAVDNILMGLLKLEKPLNIIRVGAPARVTSTLRNYTLEAALAQSPAAERVKDLRQRAVKAEGAKAKRIHQQARDLERKTALGILKAADVVLATCIGSGQEILDGFSFPMTIVDEATQATEPDVLCALRKAHAAVLVGDPVQLPPTVISQAAANAGLSISLFERLMSAGVSPTLLNTQYRMHPGLAFFPSRAFYNGDLRSNPKPADRKLAGNFKWPSRAIPAAFIQSDTSEERTPGKGASYMNAGEASTVVDVVEHLLAKGAVASLDDVGIVTPYSGQVRLLHERFSELGYKTSITSDVDDFEGDTSTGGEYVNVKGSGWKGTLEIRSVDGYQGREKEMMVFSAVRANEPGKLGFVADKRRLNVAITRARRGLVVAGNADTLNNDPVWEEWLAYLQRQGAFTSLDEFLAPADLRPR